MTDDRAFGADDVAGALYVGERLRKLRFLMTDNKQCAERNIPADTTGSAALLDAVKIYHRILPEEEAAYRSALLAAYQDFRWK